MSAHSSAASARRIASTEAAAVTKISAAKPSDSLRSHRRLKCDGATSSSIAMNTAGQVHAVESGSLLQTQLAIRAVASIVSRCSSPPRNAHSSPTSGQRSPAASADCHDGTFQNDLADRLGVILGTDVAPTLIRAVAGSTSTAVNATGAEPFEVGSTTFSSEVLAPAPPPPHVSLFHATPSALASIVPVPVSPQRGGSPYTTRPSSCRVRPTYPPLLSDRITHPLSMAAQPCSPDASGVGLTSPTGARPPPRATSANPKLRHATEVTKPQAPPPPSAPPSRRPRKAVAEVKMQQEGKRLYDKLPREERRINLQCEVPLWIIIRADRLRSKEPPHDDDGQMSGSTLTTTETLLDDLHHPDETEHHHETLRLRDKLLQEAASWRRIATLHPLTAVSAVVLTQIMIRARRSAAHVAQLRRTKLLKLHQFPRPDNAALHHTLIELRRSQAHYARSRQYSVASMVDSVASFDATGGGSSFRMAMFDGAAGSGPRASVLIPRMPTIIEGVAVVVEEDNEGDESTTVNRRQSHRSSVLMNMSTTSRMPSMRLNQSIRSFRSQAGNGGGGGSSTTDLGSSMMSPHLTQRASNMSSPFLRRHHHPHHSRASDTYRSRRRSLMAENVDENIIKENAAYCLNRFFRYCAQRWKFRMRQEHVSGYLEEALMEERVVVLQSFLLYRKTAVVYIYKSRHRNRNIAASKIQRAFRGYYYRNRYLDRLAMMESWHEQRVQKDHERDACRILLSVMIMQRAKNIVNQRKKLLAMKHSYREEAERRQRAQELMTTLTAILTSIVRRIKRSNAVKRRVEERVRLEREQEKRIRVLESVPMIQRFLLTRKSGFVRRQREQAAVAIMQEQWNQRHVMLHRVITDAISRATFRRAQAVVWSFFIRCPTLWRRRLQLLKSKARINMRVKDEYVAVIQAFARSWVSSVICKGLEPMRAEAVK